MQAPRALLGLLSIGVLVGGCNALNGSGDFNFGEGSSSGLVPEGGSGADGAGGTPDGGSTGNDGGGPADEDGGGAFNPDAGVNPKLKSCGMNLVCLPDVGGWSPAEFLFAAFGPSGGGCPAEYPQQHDLQQSGGGGCNCACSANGGSCAGSLDSRSGALCAGAAVNEPFASGQCTTLTTDLALPVAFTAHPSGATPTSCGATVMPQLGAPTLARFCTGAVASGGTCDSGEICVNRPAAFSGFGFVCIVHDGNIACPKGLSQRTLVGTAVTDGRSCSASCSCQTAPCGGTIEAFTDTACAASVRSVNVDGSCTTAGAAMSGASFRYTASSGCGVNAPATIVGSETYTAPQTLCCTIGF